MWHSFRKNYGGKYFESGRIDGSIWQTAAKRIGSFGAVMFRNAPGERCAKITRLTARRGIIFRSITRVSKAYRWNEDGIAGICDRKQHICFALAFWNGKDPILKERFFGSAEIRAITAKTSRNIIFISTPRRRIPI